MEISKNGSPVFPEIELYRDQKRREEEARAQRSAEKYDSTEKEEFYLDQQLYDIATNDLSSSAFIIARAIATSALCIISSIDDQTDAINEVARELHKLNGKRRKF